MSTNLFIIFPDNRKKTYTATPAMTLQAILNSACKDARINDPENYVLKNNNKIMDLSTTIRFLGLHAGIKLNLVKANKSNAPQLPTKVVIALQTEEGGRLRGEFLTTTTLWDILLHFEKRSNGTMNLTRRIEKENPGKGNSLMKMLKTDRYVYVQPVCIIMNKEYGTIEALKNTTLKNAGISGNCMIRLLNRYTDKTLNEMLPIIESTQTIYDKQLPRSNSQVNTQNSDNTISNSNNENNSSTVLNNNDIKKSSDLPTVSNNNNDIKKSSDLPTVLNNNDKKPLSSLPIELNNGQSISESSTNDNSSKKTKLDENEKPDLPKLPNESTKLKTDNKDNNNKVLESSKDNDTNDLMEVDNNTVRKNEKVITEKINKKSQEENKEFENSSVSKSINKNVEGSTEDKMVVDNTEITNIKLNNESDNKQLPNIKLYNELDKKQLPKIEQEIKKDTQIDNEIIEETIDRNIKFYNPPKDGNVMPTKFNLPDSFFELSSAELKVLINQQQRKANNQNNMPLMTRAMREQEDESNRKKYPKCLIRVKFPNQLMIEMAFLSNEPVSALYDEVKKVLSSKNKKFYLYTTPPKSVLSNDSLSLWKAGLVPSSNVYFNWENEKDKLSDKNYLSSEYKNKLVDYIKEIPNSTYTNGNNIPNTSSVSTSDTSKGVRLGGSSNKPSQNYDMNNRASSSSSNSLNKSNLTMKKIPKWFKLGK